MDISEHGKRGWRVDGAIYKTILLVHRLACVLFLAVVGHFAMVAVDDFRLNGDKPGKESTAGTKSEYMTMKRDGIVLVRRMREFTEFLDKDLRESINEDKMAVRIWVVVEEERRENVTTNVLLSLKC